MDTILEFSLREMDIELMRRLSPRVNVIPVVGKADSLTPAELKGFKKRVRRTVLSHDILSQQSIADHGRH